MRNRNGEATAARVLVVVFKMSGSLWDLFPRIGVYSRQPHAILFGDKEALRRSGDDIHILELPDLLERSAEEPRARRGRTAQRERPGVFRSQHRAGEKRRWLPEQLSSLQLRDERLRPSGPRQRQGPDEEGPRERPFGRQQLREAPQRQPLHRLRQGVRLHNDGVGGEHRVRTDRVAAAGPLLAHGRVRQRGFGPRHDDRGDRVRHGVRGEHVALHAHARRVRARREDRDQAAGRGGASEQPVRSLQRRQHFR